jgi:hypothetical protein
MLVDDIKCSNLLYDNHTHAYIGEAAHIIDATDSKDKDKRPPTGENVEVLRSLVKKDYPNDLKITDEKLIKSEHNCIMLCRNCHKIIDDPNYSIEKLWKIKQAIYDNFKKIDKNTKRDRDNDRVYTAITKLLDDMYSKIRNDKLKENKEDDINRINFEEKIGLNCFNPLYKEKLEKGIIYSNIINKFLKFINEETDHKFMERINNSVNDKYTELLNKYHKPLNDEKSKKIYDDFIIFFKEFSNKLNDDQLLNQACEILVGFYFNYCEIFEKTKNETNQQLRYV